MGNRTAIAATTKTVQRTGVRRMLTDIAANSWAASRLLPMRSRWRALKAIGIDAEESVILPGCYFGGVNVHIGAGTFVSNNCYFDNAAPIHVGERVDIGPNVQLITGTHKMGPLSRRAGELRNATITIGDGAWIGAGVTILPGVTIGAGAVINAGSVVTSDVEGNSLYQGVPAKFFSALTTS